MEEIKAKIADFNNFLKKIKEGYPKIVKAKKKKLWDISAVSSS